LQKKTIKLLHTEWSKGWGGQEIRILAESKAFQKKGYDVRIAAQPDSRLLSEAQKSGIPTLSITMNKGLNLPAMAKLWKYIREEKIDIVHTHSSVDSRTAGIAAKLAGAAVVRSRHISLPISKRRFTYWQYMKLADIVIVSGSYIRERMITDNGMDPEKIVSAPAGIDITQFSLERPMENIRPRYGLDESDFVVGQVSVLRSWKGHRYLLEAADRLKEELPDLKVLIVGSGPQEANIRRMVEDLGLSDRVILTGHQKDPAPFFKAMDVVTLLSYRGEATSQVLPQAMAMKKPVISTHAGGLAEVAIEGETALVVPPQNSDAVAEAIKTLYHDRDLRRSLGEKGRRLTLERFTFEKMIETTERAYLSVLKKPESVTE